MPVTATTNDKSRPQGQAAPETWLERMMRSFKLAVTRSGAAKLAEPLRDPNPQRYLDPEMLTRVAMSPLLARVVVEGFLNGLHKSPFHGFSVEFADHREYVPGDDLKYLDWALFARTDHYYIKRYEEETNLRAYILLDRSASMGFGTGNLTKWDYSCFLATCLSYLIIKQQDAVGLALFGTKPGIVMPARSRSSHLRQMMQVMINNSPDGTTDVANSLRSVVRNLKRRGLVVVISDLIDDPANTLKAIRLLKSHRHDVIVFHIQDHAELNFSFEGATLFKDMETGEELEIDPAAVRSSYLEEMRQLCEYYRTGLTEVGIDYHMINTAETYDKALSAYLNRRMRVGK